MTNQTKTSSISISVGSSFSRRTPVERAIRTAALVCGALVVLGAQATGASYADFIVRSWNSSAPFAAGFLGAVVPAAAGITVGWYLVKTLPKSYNLAVQEFLVFIGMLTPGIRASRIHAA